MPRLTREVFQSRLNCTCELLDSLALLSDETLLDMKITAIPKVILLRYGTFIETLHTLAHDAEQLAEAVSHITPAESVTLQ